MLEKRVLGSRQQAEASSSPVPEAPPQLEVDAAAQLGRNQAKTPPLPPFPPSKEHPIYAVDAEYQDLNRPFDAAE